MSIFKKHRIFWQLLIWWGFFSLTNFFLTYELHSISELFRLYIAFFIGISVTLWLNMKVLLPKYYFQHKPVQFIVLGTLLIAVIGFLLYGEVFPWSDWFDIRPPRPTDKPEDTRPEEMRRVGFRMRSLGRTMPFIFTFLGSTLIELTRFANSKEKEVVNAEKEKLETELKFLKSQVNPHFLFNALNNIYSLSVVKADHTPETIMQLSEILRYMVYDSNESQVPLSSEINYIENYVELKQLKDSRGLDIQVNLDDSHPNTMVAPLLFIPFVENAFKHSNIENIENSFISIDLEAHDHEIVFKVVNSYPDQSFTKDKVGGVGLENIQKRLDLLYPNGAHTLKIIQENGVFEVFLKLKVA